MALSSSSRPSLRGRILSRLPATLTAIGGIAVEKLNGIWTIFPDFGALTELTSLSLTNPASKQIWVYDPVTEVYNVLTLAGFGDALYAATSTSSVSVGVGSKTFITQAGKDFAVGSWVVAYGTDPSNFIAGQVTAYSGTSLTVNATAYGGSGTLASWTIRASSPPGAIGKSAGYSYSWLTDTTSADPTAGKVKANHATFASITEIYISETDADANGIAAVIAAAASGTSAKKCRFKLYDPVTPMNFMEFDVTALTDNGTWNTLAVTPRSNGGSFSAALALRADVYPGGDKGDTGASYPATSVTSNSIANSGTKTFTTQAGLAYQAGARVRASDTSAPSTNWMEGVVSSYSGTSLAFAADKKLGSGTLTDWLINVAGEPGIDGLGTGDVVGPSSSVDGEIALFNSTTGKLIKRASTTGVLKATSGVIAASTDGTDHLSSSTGAKLAGGQTLTGGFKSTPYAAGTKSTGTYTPLYSDGNFQTATNGGAHTLAPPADDCTMIIQYTNNGSAGAITTSGYTKKTGDSITTVSGDDFFFFIVKVGSFSHLHVQALQ